CVMCSSHDEEDIYHLFFSCPFAVRCWLSLGIHWDILLDIHERLLQARSTSRLPFFLEICIIGMWELWKLHNRKVFEGQATSLGLWMLRFKDEVWLQSLRLKEALKPVIFSWIDSL
ncbi:hypothetical protein BS78_06G055300, partial [Paspalum vaginatum]